MSLPYVVADATTMLRRNVRHMRRYPSLTVMLVGLPVVFLLLFVYVLGGTLGAGLQGGVALVAGGGGRSRYLAYVVPGILLIAIGSAAQGTAIAVAMDMTQGIIDRFRTMDIARAAVLCGHVLGSAIQTLLCMVVVVGVAVGIGFRPDAGPGQWAAALGILALATFAVTWLAVGLGMSAKSVETASNSPMFLILLPFFGSGFVPTGTMPGPLRWFADHQPFTPIIETIRGLLGGTPVGHDPAVAVAWCIAIAAVGYLRARTAYDRPAVR